MKESKESSPNSPTLSDILKQEHKGNNENLPKMANNVLEQILQTKELQIINFQLNESLNEDMPKNIIDPDPGKMQKWLEDTKFAKLNYKNGDKYEGGLLNIKKHGVGKIEFINEIVYTGAFSNDQIDGSGILIFPEYSSLKSYKGDFVENRFEGEGYLEYKNGNVYKGRFFKNVFSGLGIFKNNNVEINGHQLSNQDGPFSNQFIYQGNFFNGTFHEYGALFFPDHSEFYGQWENGVQINFGTYKSPEGNAYKANLEENIEKNDQYLNIFNNPPTKNEYEEIKTKAEESFKKKNVKKLKKKKFNIMGIGTILFLIVLIFILFRIYGHLNYFSNPLIDNYKQNNIIDNDQANRTVHSYDFKMYILNIPSKIFNFISGAYIKLKSNFSNKESLQGESPVQNSVKSENLVDNPVAKKYNSLWSFSQQINKINSKPI